MFPTPVKSYIFHQSTYLPLNLSLKNTLFQLELDKYNGEKINIEGASNKGCINDTQQHYIKKFIQQVICADDIKGRDAVDLEPYFLAQSRLSSFGIPDAVIKRLHDYLNKRLREKGFIGEFNTGSKTSKFSYNAIEALLKYHHEPQHESFTSYLLRTTGCSINLHQAALPEIDYFRREGECSKDLLKWRKATLSGARVGYTHGLKPRYIRFINNHSPFLKSATIRACLDEYCSLPKSSTKRWVPYPPTLLIQLE